LLYGYFYFIAAPERCVGERVVCVSLNLDDAIVKDRLIGNISIRYQSSQKLRTTNPKDYKNLMFDALNFFFYLMQLDE